MDFPRIGINTEELVAEVHRLLRLAYADHASLGAVNWGDLGVSDVQYRLSMLRPDEGPHCVVTIEEASPDCKLHGWLFDRLDKERYPSVYFECEW